MKMCYIFIKKSKKLLFFILRIFFFKNCLIYWTLVHVSSIAICSSFSSKNLTNFNFTNWKSFPKNFNNHLSEITSNVMLNLNSKQNQIRHKNSNYVAIDCEMVGTGENGKGNMLARVSIVNPFDECIYDTFVKPIVTITDYRTSISGVRPNDLINAERFSVVQKKVADLINNKILIGHALYYDLLILKLYHPRKYIRDTSTYSKFNQIVENGIPNLKVLASHFLQKDIQNGEHSSIEDAQAAMQLYMLYQREWETELELRKHLKKYNRKIF